MNIADDDTPAFPGDFQGYRISESLDLNSIEARSLVIDDQHASPGVPFGYLNGQWRAFKGLVESSRLRHGDEVEVVEYRIPLTSSTLEGHLLSTGSQIKWPESVVYAARYKQKVLHTFWASGALDSDY